MASTYLWGPDFILYHLDGVSFPKLHENYSQNHWAVGSHFVCVSPTKEIVTSLHRFLHDHQCANTILRGIMYKWDLFLQPYIFLWWAPPVHSEQWRDRDCVVSEGPAALETAHVLFLPEQLRGRMKARTGRSPRLELQTWFVHFTSFRSLNLKKGWPDKQST